MISTYKSQKTPNFLENYVWMWSGWNNLSFPLQNQNFDVTQHIILNCCFVGLSLKWLGIRISKLFEIMNTIFGNLTHPWIFLMTFSLLSIIDVTDITYFILKLRRNIRNTINFSLMLVALKANNLYSLLLCYSTYIDLLLHVYESMETSKSFSIS